MTAVILSALMLVTPVVTESGKFTIRQNGRNIGTEEFSIRAQGKGFIAEGRTRIDGDPDTLVSKMELDEKLIPTSYEYSHGKGTIRIKIESQSSELTIGGKGESSTTNFRFPDGATIVDNNFFHHYLILLYRMNGSEASFPIFVPQDMQAGLATIRSTGTRMYSLEVGAVKLEATVDEAGRLLRLAVPSANVVVER